MTLLASKSRHVFVDESGDPDIDTQKEGSSEYFVLTALIVDTPDLDSEEAQAAQIIRRYFPRGELKSSSIGGNLRRRKRILNDISQLSFVHYSQVIDKSLIRADSGLRYRRSFIKYINRILYRNLFHAFTDLYVVADQHGKSDFMQGFPGYLGKRLPPRLFERYSFRFAESTSHPLLQVADLIAGTIRRCYEGADPIPILQLIRSHTIIIDEWPPRFPEPLGYEHLSEQEQHGYLVRKHALDKANEFIEDRSFSTDHYVQAQVAAVRYLLYHFRSVDPEQYIATSVLHNHLSELGLVMSVRTLRQRVIAALRDEGVFIASARKGIKIPYSVSDLVDFVSTVNGQVVPYLQRLEICRKHFLLATEGRLDIVDDRRFPKLHRYMAREAEPFK